MMSNHKYSYYDYLMKINGLQEDEEDVNNILEEQNNNYNNLLQKNQNQNKNLEYNNINEYINNNENRKQYNSPIKKSVTPAKVGHKDKEIEKLKEELESKRKEIEKYKNLTKVIEELQKKNEEANKKIEQLNEELRAAQRKKRFTKRSFKNIESNSISPEKYSNLNIDNNNSINIYKFSKLFNEEEKKALSTLFKSDKDLHNFNNKISILEDRNARLENELKEKNRKLVKELNDKNEQIRLLEKKLTEKEIEKDNYENDDTNRKNTIEVLKKEINHLKQHKFNILLMKKQVQVFYIGGKINYIDNSSDYIKKQKRLLKKVSDDGKKKVIKIKKIKGNKE